MKLATDKYLVDSFLRFRHRITAWLNQRKSKPLPFLKHCKRLPALSFVAVVALSGCGGGGAPAVATGATTGGGAIKGPLDCSAQGSVIATGSAGKTATGSTPSTGSFTVDMTGLTFPVTVRVSGCMDTVTGATQEFDLSTMVMDSTQTVINATSISTLAVAAAKAAKVGGGAITQADLDAAVATVLNAFGLSAALPNPVTGVFKTAADVTNLALAAEALGEVIKRSATATPGGASIADIMASFAADLADGALDGVAPAGVTIPVPVATASGVNGNLIAKVFDEVAVGQLLVSQVDPLTGVVLNVLPLSAFTNAVAAMATATSGTVVTAASINLAATPTAVNAMPSSMPVIALTGANPLTAAQGSTFTDPGSTVTDNVDTGLTATVTGSVNTAVVGTYTLTYNVSDAAGNAATVVTRTVNVTDQTVPVIALIGANPLTVAQGSAFTDPGSTVTDNVDAGLTATVTGTVNTATVGTYALTYNSSDAVGNAAIAVTRTVNVTDQTAPVIALTGANPLTVAQGSAFTDPGSTVTDNVDVGLTATVTGTVNIATVGAYTLTYNVSDAAGNAATAVTRVVNVITPPNHAPTASNIVVSDSNGGSVVVGDSLNGSYTYGDIDGDAEGSSTFCWLRNGTAISRATVPIYTLLAADSGQTITFEVTPVAVTGVVRGTAVTSAGMSVINSPPVASSVNISDSNGGSILVGDILRGNYTYSDADNDIEGASTFRWLRNGTAIVGATTLNYTMLAADVGQSIAFEVTPVATTGAVAGNAVVSIGVSSIFSASATLKSVDASETVTVAGGGSISVAQNQVLVYLKDDITPAELTALEQAIGTLGGTVLGSSRELGTIQVGIPSTASEANFINAIKPYAGVRSADYNLTLSFSYSNDVGYSAFLKSLPKPAPIMARRALVPATYPAFNGDYWITAIGADKAWSTATGSAAPMATIGIVDSGIKSGQTALAKSRLTRFNGISEQLIFGDDSRFEEHGMYVTALAAGNTASTRGVAWLNHVVHVDVGYTSQICTFGICFDTLKKLHISDTLTGIITALNKGAKLINVSIGAGSCADGSAQQAIHQIKFRDSMTSALVAARKKDALLIFAASNSCLKNDDTLIPFNAIDKAGTTSLWNSNALIVASTHGINPDNRTYTDADDSVMGKVVNIAAPGVCVGWGGGGITGFSDSPANVIACAANAGSGTSFAAPLVTGSAGVVKGVNLTLAAPEVRHILMDSADPIIKFSTPASGATPTAPNKFLNLDKAVQEAQLTTATPLDDTIPLVDAVKGTSYPVNIPVLVPSSGVSALDVVFLTDVSGSYGSYIASMQTQTNQIITDLLGRGIDVNFGVASFSDFPMAPYGDAASGDKAYYLNQAVTSNTAAVTAAVASLDKPLHNGNDWPESQLEALFQVAGSKGLDINNDSVYTGVGELSPTDMGWRPGALRVVVFSTDAFFHDSDLEAGYPGHGFAAVLAELKAQDVLVIGIQSGGNPLATTDVQRVVTATGGSMYNLGSNTSLIASSIASALNAALAKINLSLEIVSGSEWLTLPLPADILAAPAGSTQTFTVNVQGIKNTTGTDKFYDVYVWVRGNGSAIIKRAKIPVVVR